MTITHFIFKVSTTAPDAASINDSNTSAVLAGFPGVVSAVLVQAIESDDTIFQMVQLAVTKYNAANPGKKIVC